MSTENNPDEKELWASIPRSEGVDRAEHFVTLSHMAYERENEEVWLGVLDDNGLSSEDFDVYENWWFSAEGRTGNHWSKAVQRLMASHSPHRLPGNGWSWP